MRERDGRGVGDWGVIFEWVPVLPSSQDAQDAQDARKGVGGRWAQRDGVWIRGVRGRGQATGDQRLGRGARSGGREGRRAGGPNARSDRESGPGPGRGRASSVPLAAHSDARRTNQPAPHQLSTPSRACGLSVCPCQSVFVCLFNLWRIILF